MGANGLLLLTSSTRNILSSSRLKQSLISGSNWLAGVLYVYQWFPQVGGGGGEDVSSQITRNSLISSRVYTQAQQYSPKLDIRFLYEKSLENSQPGVKIDLVLVEKAKGEEVSRSLVKSFVLKNFEASADFEIRFIESDCEKEEEGEVSQVPFPRFYPKVILGGTFDRMHVAHKILITEAALRCSQELIVGVTDDDMIKSKLLYELIEPMDMRMERVSNFLRDISPRLNNRVVPISDPFGPSIIEEDIELLVLSHESAKGGVKINEIRREKKFPELDTFAISLYEESQKESDHEEDKISSSSQRIRILGDRLNPPRKPTSLPYIIGLTGGICSGKSTLCSYLETLGIPSINCDLLGHEAYKKGTLCFQQVVDEFGNDVLTEDGDEINRRVLGSKVFASPDALAKLNGIVWPEIRRLISERIEQFSKEGTKAVVLDAAILLEAGWDELCHDVWVVIIPKEEAIKRVQERDKLPKEDAERRVLSQVSNHERVKRATFVFSSLWEHDFTRRQANKAWQQIKPLIDSL